jgi:hypothetical protein
MAASLNRPQASTPPAAPAADAPNPIAALLGTVQYQHETGAIALYQDKRRPAVKNGRAGYVSVLASPKLAVNCSVYMDVERVTKTVDGKTVTGTDKKYRLSFPKNVKAIFGSADEEKRWKGYHLAAWKTARVAKQQTADASGDDATVQEFEADE